MSYIVEMIPKEKQTASSWSGGKTTELAIFPRESEYKKRNFKWRLSSATVETEESTFTSLPGISRHLMILEGEMELKHEGHYSILLKPYEQDSFSGDWTSRSIGKARDFNLMLAEGCEGSLEAINAGKGMSIEVLLCPENVATEAVNYAAALYCAAGEVNISVDRAEIYTLRQDDLMLLSFSTSDGDRAVMLEVNGQAASTIIAARISY